MSDTPDGLEIVPLTPDTWTMFDAMVARHNGIFGGCWCIWFHPDSNERGQGAEANRALKKRYVEQCAAHAALVVDGDEAVAWAEYGTPAELPNIHHRKQYLAEQDLEPDFRITCIFVDKRFRGNGLVTVALLGALAHRREVTQQAPEGRCGAFRGRSAVGVHHGHGARCRPVHRALQRVPLRHGQQVQGGR